MSNFKDFLNTRILRHPTTWIMAVGGGIYGGLDMYWLREAQRAAGAELRLPALWLDRSSDFLFGASFQVVMLLCAVWFLAGLIEELNVWGRQGILLATYLAINLLCLFL